MQLQQVLALVATLLLSGALAAAPGDESDTCLGDYPSTLRVLMDSYNYENLLEDRRVGNQAPWIEIDFDGDGRSVNTCRFIPVVMFIRELGLRQTRSRPCNAIFFLSSQ